ncbi:Uncharacterized protein FWK35_00022147 [Aphis craccivora]|uniref:DUF4485 domain-containing protein n=1 Tax=Aphis craccivora TaxID=307492 RepID=A0A6G0YS72_APHCR|nr:Uncharacterized protein FWK35_00022147 [Aphis craccivora]
MTSISEINDKTSTRKPNPTDDEDVTFFFFYDLVKQLILKRNDIRDASVLSCWLKVLEQNKNKTVLNECIKLMTLALQYSDPICPFKDPPPETIDPLENEVIEMARKFLNKEGTATCIGDNEYDIAETHPTISTAMSNNKCQYASYQGIPNVSVQCYYAFSDEPMALVDIKLQLVTSSTDNLKPPNAQENITVKDRTQHDRAPANVKPPREKRLIAFDESLSDLPRIQWMSKPIRRPSALNATDFCTGGNHNRVVFSRPLGRCDDDGFTGSETRLVDRRSKGQSFKAYPENLSASVSSLTDPKCVRFLAQQLYIKRSSKSRDGDDESDGPPPPGL